MTSKDTTEKTPLKPQKRTAEDDDYKYLTNFEQFKQSLSDLKYAPRDYWLLLMSKFGNYTSFNIITLSAMIYLIEVQKFSDLEAGAIIVFLGICGIIYSISFGFMPDHYGISKTLMTANIVGSLGFILLIFISNRYMQVLLFLTFIVFSVAVSQPATKLAVKRYTSENIRSIGYSIYYLVYYGSGAVAGLLIDITLTLGDENLSTFRTLFIISAFCLIAASIISFFLRELNYHTRGEEEVEIREASESGFAHIKGVFIFKSFWRFLLLTLLLVLSRSVYYHLNITLPIYMYRDIEEGAHFGYMILVHEVVMIIGLPTFTFLIYYFNCYSLLILGAIISSVAPLVFVLGSGYLHVAVFVIVASIGESIHVPRFVEYTISIAPVGKEGVFLALAAAPLPLSLIISGLSAGFLLHEYCPEDGERDCWIMWTIISGISAITPVFMLIFRPQLEQPLFEPQPYMSWAKEAKENN